MYKSFLQLEFVDWQWSSEHRFCFILFFCRTQSYISVKERKRFLLFPLRPAPFLGAETLRYCELCERLESLEESYNPILQTRSNIHEALLRCGFQAKAKFKFPPVKKRPAKF